MDKVLIEIKKLKKEIEMLEREKNINIENQNGLTQDLNTYSNLNTKKTNKKIKNLKIKNLILYIINIGKFALMPLCALVGLVANPIISVVIATIGAVLVIGNELPKMENDSNETILDSLQLNVQTDIEDLTNRLNTAKEVCKNKGYYQETVLKLKNRNNEIDAYINQKNKKIAKLEAIRKEILDEISPLIDQKISTNYANIIEEDTNVKPRVKVRTML